MPPCPGNFVFLVEMGFIHVGQAGLESRPQVICLPWPPKVLGLQVQVTTLDLPWVSLLISVSLIYYAAGSQVCISYLNVGSVYF